jgi:ABC-type phosphate/phosphonate transport system substrate-binding protein
MRYPRIHKWLRVQRVTVLCLALAGRAALGGALEPVHLNVGFMRTCFLGVNRNDAEGAFRVLCEMVGHKRGYEVTTRTAMYDSAAEIRSAIQGGTVNLAIIDSWKYLGMDLGDRLEALFVTSDQGKVGRKYLLLTQRASGVSSLADLRGKDILELEVANTSVGQAWLDTLLQQQQQEQQTTFFGAVKFVGKPSLAVLPVFFGKQPACLVDHFSYELMCELNPQVGQSLRVVAGSEPYADNVVCLTRGGWPSDKARKDVIDVLAQLHQDPAGQQILTLFKVGPMIPFQESLLETVKTLRASHAQTRNPNHAL